MDGEKEESTNEDESIKTAELEFREKILYGDYDVFNRRVNMFLLSESMLLISYVTSLNIGNQSSGFMINSLGISISILYSYVLWRQANNIEINKKFLVKVHCYFRKMSAERSRGIPSNIVLGIILPLILLLIWVLLFFYNILIMFVI